jgi:hypothetical protein
MTDNLMHYCWTNHTQLCREAGFARDGFEDLYNMGDPIMCMSQPKSERN